jgi:hypothetical protein
VYIVELMRDDLRASSVRVGVFASKASRI